MFTFHPTTIFIRALLGTAASGAVALTARRVHALDMSGAVAAVVVGTMCVAAGWDWALLLVAFFVTSTALSRLGKDRKERLASGVLTKGSERDAIQVLANGGLFAFCAVGYVLRPAPVWQAGAAGALAAATADTWATEIGMLFGGTPRSILGWRRVPPGTSGGISGPGTAAAFAGAAFAAGVLRLLEWPGGIAVGALVGGMAGAFGDSLLGATVQARRWCNRCHTPTERAVHSCGEPTTAGGGVAWLDNDGVNAVSTVVGGVVSGLMTVVHPF